MLGPNYADATVYPQTRGDILSNFLDKRKLTDLRCIGICLGTLYEPLESSSVPYRPSKLLRSRASWCVL